MGGPPQSAFCTGFERRFSHSKLLPAVSPQLPGGFFPRPKTSFRPAGTRLVVYAIYTQVLVTLPGYRVNRFRYPWLDGNPTPPASGMRQSRCSKVAKRAVSKTGWRIVIVLIRCPRCASQGLFLGCFFDVSFRGVF